jgi:hypothetical protein
VAPALSSSTWKLLVWGNTLLLGGICAERLRRPQSLNLEEALRLQFWTRTCQQDNLCTQEWKKLIHYRKACHIKV